MAFAAAAHFGHSLPDKVAAVRRAMGVVRVLHSLPSGRVGDYVACLFAGTVTLADLVGLTAR